MTVTNGLPTAPHISRALKRDFGIITQPFPKPGYCARRGNGRTVPAQVWVSVSDLDSANVRKAGQLAEAMTAAGYDIDHRPDSSIVYVKSIPAAADAKAALAAAGY
ncbi:hypothetical protein KAYACHO_94 [Mycobacterium phage KayaCho]|uniref:hypothetical protein n=1 Tax=Mycobacterium phage KayaCho TaxID=1340830 RepID=UPI0003881BC0|nr:hypothetical protein N846_gp94 [Mycobacterium phage KayaCho]AGT12998.1 hypothetical protein KAYACHO_94 [Mycobacterium phage KayaCho]